MSDETKTYTAADMRSAFTQGAELANRLIGAHETSIKRAADNRFPDPKPPERKLRVVQVESMKYRMNNGVVECKFDGSSIWNPSVLRSRTEIRQKISLFNDRKQQYVELASLFDHPYED